MVKYLLIFINIIVAVAYLFITDGEVVVTPIVPDEVKAGDEFLVRINIKKGDLTHYARFMQQLPPGFVPSPVETRGAQFNYMDNNAKFTWLNLPEEEEFEIIYKVTVDTNIYGNFSITGKFAYVDEDFERKAIAYSEWTTIVVLNEQYKDKIFENASFQSGSDPSGLTCIRKRRVEGNDVVVDVIVEKNANKYAKIYEIVPDGFNASAIESNSGIFAFHDNTVKFMWQNCPSGNFTVSYKLTPSSGSLTAVPEITGTFFYMSEVNRNTISVVIRDESDPSLQNKTGTQTENTLSDNTNLDTGKDTIEETKVPDPNTNNGNKTGNNTADNSGKQPDKTDDGKNNLADNNGNKTGQNNSDGKSNKTGNQQSGKNSGNVSRNNSGSSASYGTPIPDPITAPGVSYSVQICALKKFRPASYFNRNASFRINDKINLELHEGWNKYTVGSFQYYLIARDYRDHLLSSTPASQAFIAAYNNGDRITVQEALMIAGQKWCR